MDSADPRKISGKNGQACFCKTACPPPPPLLLFFRFSVARADDKLSGFNNGCDIGCDKCDGVTGQKIPCCTKKFHYKGFEGMKHPGSGWNAWTSENIVPDADYVAKFNRSAMRPTTLKYPDRKATICDKRLRTVNTNAECGAPDDFWVSFQ